MITPPDALAQEWVQAYVGVGANLGDAAQSVRAALQKLAEMPGVRAVRASSLYGSAPVDAFGDDYVNAVLGLQTRLDALALLQALQGIEAAAGRQRPYRNAPRTLDLDLLLYGDQRIDQPALEVPHPRMWQRAFVLIPLSEIAPELVSSQALQAVAAQRIWRLQGLS